MKIQLPISENVGYTTAMGALSFAINNRHMLILLGEPGTGKSTLLKNCRNENFALHYILCSPTMSMADILRKIGRAAEINVHGNCYDMQEQIINGLGENSSHCFLLDECEYLNHNNITKLEVLRQIWDETASPFIFSGTYILEAALKGNSKRRTNHSQIHRRLFKATLGTMTKAEANEYLDMLEKMYVVRFTPDARNCLYAHCQDRENGGLGNFISLIQLAFLTVRPEWKDITLQNYYAEHPAEFAKYGTDDATDLLTQEPVTKLPFEPIDTQNLKIAVIDQEVMRGAMKYKVTF